MGEDKGGLTPEQLAAARLRERADNVDRFLADNESERDGWLSSMPVAEMRRDAEELRSTADVLDAQAEEIERLRAALKKADEGLSHITRWAPVAADFEAGGKFDYAEGCGNADDAATLGAERCHFRLAEHARHALRAISPVLYGPAAPASDALDAVREAQRAGEALEKYGDDHEWGFMPVGVTLDRFQDALAALARVFGSPPPEDR